MKQYNEEMKKGYLYEDFRFVHLRDKKVQQYEYHFHEFKKVVIFLSGKVTYIVEGKSYYLKPWDILLVNSQDLHKAFIDENEMYDRIVLWISDTFIERCGNAGCDLAACFKLAGEKRFNLVRLDLGIKKKMTELLADLELTLASAEFGSSLLAQAYLMEFMVHLNRLYMEKEAEGMEQDFRYDRRMEQVMQYINSNLAEDLSVDALAEKFYISKYYLMHRFKEETGFTLHKYIIQKRIYLAAEYMKSGSLSTGAAEKAGFRDYSSFLRSYKKIFGSTPRQR